MPCNQMTSMNISPPRPTDARKLEMLPALKARIRKSERRNIGSGERRSTWVKMNSMATPPTSDDSTKGLSQPMVRPPYGWIP